MKVVSLVRLYNMLSPIGIQYGLEWNYALQDYCHGDDILFFSDAIFTRVGILSRMQIEVNMHL